MAETIQYKCPCCGGRLEFDSGLQKMKCPYCDTTFDVETLEGYDDALKQDAKDDMHWDAAQHECVVCCSIPWSPKCTWKLVICKIVVVCC